MDHVLMVMALLRWFAPALAPESEAATLFIRIVFVIGAGLVFFAAALRTWGTAYLRREIVHDTGQHSHALVADGPYRYTRNPLYFAALPMAIGIGLMASRAGFLFMVIANWIFVYRLIYREEAALRETQGESYRAYCAAVPRFWPALSPRVPSGNASPRWAQSFVGESFVWIFGLAELGLALTLSEKFVLTVFILGMVVHLIMRGRVLKSHGR